MSHTLTRSVILRMIETAPRPALPSSVSAMADRTFEEALMEAIQQLVWANHNQQYQLGRVPKPPDDAPAGW